MTPWIVGLPLVIFAFVFSALIWEDHHQRIAAFSDRIVDEIEETLEDIGRVD